jgi:hypothetical protein
MSLSSLWRIALAVALGAVIVVSVYGRAPVRAAPPGELRRLVLCALGLYAVGGLASLTHHPALGGLVYATGIATCALAAWLSRGQDSEGPPRGDEPGDGPPPDPGGRPELDGTAFERDFREYAQGLRETAGHR